LINEGGYKLQKNPYSSGEFWIRKLLQRRPQEKDGKSNQIL
jgi:hypothetical protein